MCAQRFVGNCEWEEITEPVPSKNDWGVDVITREFSGRRDKYEAFVRGFKQGATFAYTGGTFYLQTWTAQHHRSFPIVSAVYKGFIGGQPPKEVYEEDTSLKSTTKSMTVSGEERTYEITYVSPQKLYRFITNNANNIDPPRLTYNLPQLLTSFYITEEGKKKSGYPTGTTILGIVEGHRKSPILGTPFWENQLTVSGVILS